MARYQCANCGKTFSTDSSFPRCPRCSSFRVSEENGGSLFDFISNLFK